jgi:hypothetical protein
MRKQIKHLKEMAKEQTAHAFFYGWLSGYVRNAESSTVEIAEEVYALGKREPRQKNAGVQR